MAADTNRMRQEIAMKKQYDPVGVDVLVAHSLPLGNLAAKGSAIAHNTDEYNLAFPPQKKNSLSFSICLGSPRTASVHLAVVCAVRSPR